MLKGKTSTETEAGSWFYMFIHNYDDFVDEIPSLSKYEVAMGPWL